MNRKIYTNILATLVMIFLFSACANNGMISETPTDPVVESPSQTTSESNDELEEQFMASLPDATIIDSIYADIDNDNTDDFVAIFEYPKDGLGISKSSVGVAFGDGLFKAVDLASGYKNYVFADNSERLKIFENSIVQVLLHNTETNQIISYKVTFDKQENGFDVKIAAEEYQK